MKKWLLSIFLLFCFSILFADQPEKTENLSSKVVLQNGSGYFVLSDRSFYKVLGFSKRWRTLKEWWNNEKLLVPENYDCVPNDWYLGAEIAVYPKERNRQVAESNASNQEDLKQCTHLLVNTKTNQVLFGIELEPRDFIVYLFKEARNEGWCSGSSEGYNRGHLDGFRNGYLAGYQDGVNRCCRRY